MKEVYAHIVAYFDEQVALCKEKEQICAADGRGDESVFEKIRGNVYDIFRTIFAVAVRLHGEDGEAVAAFFKGKLNGMPTGWQAERDNAAAHGDEAKAHIEDVKLDTVRRIREDLAGIWEDLV